MQFSAQLKAVHFPCAGMQAKVPFTISPGSEQIRATIQRDGFMDTFAKASVHLLAWGGRASAVTSPTGVLQS